VRQATQHSIQSVADAYAATLDDLTARICPPWHSVDWSQGSLFWRLFHPPDWQSPQQGWKVHISASAIEAAELFALVVPLLVERAAAFKLPRSFGDVLFVNSGDAGAMMMGKVVTIYPRDDEHVSGIATCVDRIWPLSRGPEVQSDLHLRPGSAVSLRYGVFGSAPVVTNSTGVCEFALVTPSGELEADARKGQGAQPAWTPVPPLPCTPPRALPVALQQTLEMNGNRYVPVALVSDKPTTKIFLAVDTTALSTVIVKVAVPGAAGDAWGRDATDNLRKEIRILEALSAHAGLAPRVLDWSDGEWPICVLEDFRGELLSELDRGERIESLLPLVEAASLLHDAGVVHGDLKLENAVRRGDTVGLIDFELAAREGDAAGAGGTRGHLAPEVSAGRAAAGSRDVFALGGCVAQAVLGIPPGLLPGGKERLRGLLELEGADGAADLVDELCANDAERRPTARQAAAAVARRLDDLRGMSPREGSPSDPHDLRWCRRAAVEAASLVQAYAVKDSNGRCWRNDHFMRDFHCEAINIGAAGILIGLASIDSALGRTDFAEPIAAGARWLSSGSGAGKSAGLFTGNAGVAVALALSGRRLGDDALIRAGIGRLHLAAVDDRESDLFSGSAGVVLASCIMSDMLADQSLLEPGNRAVELLRKRFDGGSDIPAWPVDPAADVRYLGCAHGSAGVALALACWARRTDDRRLLELAIETFQRLFQHGRTADGRAMRMTLESSRAHTPISWCHGVAGYVWCVLQACGDDTSCRREIDWAVSVLADSAVAATPTYCHGLAGQLELWQMLSAIPRFEGLASARAGKIVRALRLLHEKRQGMIAWCSDDPAITTPDLWIGFLGPATALALHAAGHTAPLLSSDWLASRASEPAGPASEPTLRRTPHAAPRAS
jgi:hypothetical protein